jgi:hypothetical protein
VDESLEELLGLRVGGVNVDATQAAGERHLVDVAHQKVEVGVADLRGVAEVGVAVGAADGDPPAAPDEIESEQDAVPLVLETLGGIDAADLAEASLVAGPQRGRGSAATDRSPLRFQGGDQSPIWTSGTSDPSAAAVAELWDSLEGVGWVRGGARAKAPAVVVMSEQLLDAAVRTPEQLGRFGWRALGLQASVAVPAGRLLCTRVVGSRTLLVWRR